MSELEINSTQFGEEVLNSSVPVLVDFWAEWCGPCRAIGPSIAQIAEEFEGKAKVFKVNIDENMELAEEYQIMSIPALLVFKDGNVVDRKVGGLPKTTISSMLQNAIDMEELEDESVHSTP